MTELLLKASFLLGVALLFYKFALQQESFFATNRLYLLASLLLAFALPHVQLPKLVDHQGYLSSIIQPLQPSILQPVMTTGNSSSNRLTPPAAGVHQRAAQETSEQALTKRTKAQKSQETAVSTDTPLHIPTDWRFWLAGFYLFGVLIFTLHLLFQLGSLFLQIARAPEKIRDGKFVLITLSQRQAPCSFFNFIFIYPDDYDFETYEQILTHEKIHVQQGHSFDLLLAELAVIILWFNPLVWLFKKEVEKNIEFQTDALLLQQASISKQQYQLSLLQIATPHKPLSLTTNYNQSLLKQRILMMNAKKSTLHGYWKYAFLAPLFFGSLLFLNEPANSQTPAPPAARPAPATTPQVNPTAAPAPHAPLTAAPKAIASPAAAPAAAPVIGGEPEDMSKGYWYSRQKEGNYCIRFSGDQDNSRNSWSTSDCFDKALFVKKEEGLYELSRESGTLTLRGNLGDEVSQGKYVFTKNPAFEKYLSSNGISSSDRNFVFFLFLSDVGKDYINFLKTQYADVHGDRLLEVAIHGISQQQYKEYMALFQKYSNKKPSMQEVVEASIHDIDQAYVQELQSLGFNNLSLQKMMEARIHDVDRAYVEELRKAGFENLSLNKIIEARIHDLDAASINEIRSLGFDLDLDEIMDVKIHDVDAAYIQDLKAAGFTNLSLDEILEARIHDITPAAIQEIQSLGFKDLSLRKMVEIQIHDLDADFIKGLQEVGFINLSLDKLLEAKIHEVSGNYIKKARKNGYNYDRIDQYIQLRIHGMARDGDNWD